MGLRIEAQYEITAVRRGATQHGEIVLSGHVRGQKTHKPVDGIRMEKLEIHLHTDNGQCPYPLGHVLKITITD